MFGVLKGSTCSLSPSEKKTWIGHICGICASLQTVSGFPSRIATNYDAALLSVLFDALAPQAQTKRSSHCPFRPSFKTEIVAENNPGVKYAASMALLAASSKIRDHLIDNDSNLKYIKGIANRVSDRWRDTALATTSSFGLEGEVIEHQIRHQISVESQPNQGFLYYSRPTELAVGTAFGNTAIIANGYQSTDIIRELGQMFGRIMYLLDSYKDYASDLASNKFNALANAFPEEEIDHQVREIFQNSYKIIKKGLFELDIQRSALLYTLLLKGLKKKGNKALQVCESNPTNCKLQNARTIDTDLAKLQFGDIEIKSRGEDPHYLDSRNEKFRCWHCCGESCNCCTYGDYGDCCDCIDCCNSCDSVCGCCECNECICGGADCCCSDCCC